MEAVGASLPKLDGRGAHDVSTPLVGHRNRLVPEFCSHFGEL